MCWRYLLCLALDLKFPKQISCISPLKMTKMLEDRGLGRLSELQNKLGSPVHLDLKVQSQLDRAGEKGHILRYISCMQSILA